VRDGSGRSLTSMRSDLPSGTVTFVFTDVDDYGRLLRYVVRASDGVNVNVRLVAVGAAAPYFYDGRRGDTRTG
jgi:endonuclease YncB( thermonuclease family)